LSDGKTATEKQKPDAPRPRAPRRNLNKTHKQIKRNEMVFNCHTLVEAESVQSKIGAKNRQKVAQSPEKAGA